MSRADMARRAPGARAVGIGRLAGHRLVVTRAGYLSVRRAPGGMVHGVLWRLTPRDLVRLDAYEGVGPGGYRRAVRPVLTAGGARAAIVYHGGRTVAGARLLRHPFEEAVLASAISWHLPVAALTGLRRLARNGFRG
ncbi:gamma-glutamylcyclotransferase family protein [Phreatobacter cathodiphilus]